jgi:beta-lactamase class A
MYFRGGEMNLGPNLSYNVRVTKRKFNKFRFLTILCLLFVCIAGAIFLSNAGIRKSINDIFAGSPNTEVTSKGIQENDISSIATTENSENSSISATSDTDDTKPPIDKKIIRDFSSLKSDIENYISGFQGQYGVYFIDLVNIGEFGINDTDIYVAASTVKIPINLYLFEKFQEGSINPDGTMIYNKSIDNEPGTGRIQNMKNGSKFTIRRLSELSIKESDNVATNMLIRLLGKQNYKDFMRSSGGTIVTDKNVSCPKDMATYMKKVYEFEKSDKAFGDELINSLENTIFNDRIPKLLPKEVKVAHKIGNYWGESWGIALHDVGIVYGENDYILAVMSKNIKEAEGFDVIANISKKVYDFMTTENPIE